MNFSSTQATLALAILSGVCFAQIGVAFRLAHGRRISLAQIVIGSNFVGFVFFISQMPMGLWRGLPAAVWLWGLLAGLGQYACLKLAGPALRRGPLSPYWCASNLSFLLPIILAAVWSNESINRWQMAGVFAGILSIVVGASGMHNGTPLNPHRPNIANIAIYVAILLLLLLFNSVPGMAMKMLWTQASREGWPDMHHYDPAWLVVLYGSYLLCAFMDELLAGRRLAGFHRGLPLAALAALGSIGGFICWQAAAALPAAALFTASSVTSTVTAGVISVLWLKEQATARWWGLMALALITIFLVQAQ